MSLTTIIEDLQEFTSRGGEGGEILLLEISEYITEVDLDLIQIHNVRMITSVDLSQLVNEISNSLYLGGTDIPPLIPAIETLIQILQCIYDNGICYTGFGILCTYSSVHILKETIDRLVDVEEEEKNEEEEE